MRSILFYPDAAEALNARVQEKIAPHLFIVANYNPETVYAFSTDAKFSKAINNLYKLAIDASIINWLFKIKDKFEQFIIYDRNTLNTDIQLITKLRSVFDHNLSEKNGTDENNQYYKRWLKKYSGKEEITTSEDFEKPLAELERIGNEIISITTSFIDNASKANDRATIILNWESCIYDFYNSTNGENIIKAQLLDAYKSRVVTRNIREKQIERNIIAWCKKMYIDEKQCYIDIRKELISRIKERTAIAKLNGQISEMEQAIKQIKRNVAVSMHKGDESKIRDSSYYYYYTKHFSDRIQLHLKEKKVNELTLLPQDVVEIIIEYDFKNVAPPQ